MEWEIKTGLGSPKQPKGNPHLPSAKVTTLLKNPKKKSALPDINTEKQKAVSIAKKHAPTLNLTATKISKAILAHGIGTFDVVAPSIVAPRWAEMDVFGLMKSGYVHEFEIKVSKSDYKADFKKTTCWKGYKFEGLKHHQLQAGECYPNRFYFVLPAHLADVELPDYAGLILAYGNEYGGVQLKWIKQAPTLHKEKHVDEQGKYRLLRKLASRYTSMLLSQ